MPFTEDMDGPQDCHTQINKLEREKQILYISIISLMSNIGFSRVAAAFSSYDGDLSLPLGLALGSPIFPSGCEGKLGVALESLQGLRDLT